MRSCGEVETIGKHEPRRRALPEDEKRKRGGSSKDSLDSNERQGRSSRRNSPVRSGTHRATTEESERKRCNSGQVKCKGLSNLRNGGTKPGRERKWNRKIPTPKDNKHGRSFFSDDGTLVRANHLSLTVYLRSTTSLLPSLMFLGW